MLTGLRPLRLTPFYRGCRALLVGSYRLGLPDLAPSDRLTTDPRQPDFALGG